MMGVKKTNKILKRIGWVIASPIILLFVLCIAIYIPPIQKLIVDLTANYLSNETGMQISVDRFRLKFPLDFSVGDVLAVQDTDTVLYAHELLLDVKLKPLFNGELLINNAAVNGCVVDTKDMIDAMKLSGRIGSLQSDHISMAFNDGNMTVPLLVLNHSSICITMADSVPEDTSESSESFLKSIRIDRADIDDVAFNMNLAPSSDSTYISTHFGTADFSCMLDLEGGNYNVDSLVIHESDINYDIGKATPLAGFDPNHINLSGVNANISSLYYLSTGELKVNIRNLAANERGGLSLASANGVFKMDETCLMLADCHLNTEQSALQLNFVMDLNAFDDVNPGQLSIDAAGYVGKDDIIPFASDFARNLKQSWPQEPLNITLSANGNMQRLDVNQLSMAMDGKFDIKGDLTLTNLMDEDGNIGVKTHIDAKGGNLSFVNGLLPADVASSFKIPAGMSLTGDFSMADQHILADAYLNYGRSSASLKADYNMNNDAYDIDFVADSLAIDAFVPLTDSCSMTGHLLAKGQGFNFDSSKTYSDVKIDVSHVDYGTYYLNGTQAALQLNDHQLDANIDFGDPRIDGSFTVSGTMANKGVAAAMILDLPFADICALGLSDEPLTAHATHGNFKANSNFGDIFLVDAVVDGVEVVYKNDSLTTEKFNLYAQSTVDTTMITLHTSDFNLDFHASSNLSALIDQFTKIGSVTAEQLRTRSLDLEYLKQMMPDVTLSANIGNQNPISKFIFMQGIKYGAVGTNIRTSKEYGLQGTLHAYNVNTDSIAIDTIFIDLNQDSSRISVDVGINCPDQDLCSAFTANLNGYLSPRIADIHLTYLNAMQEKGIDLGVIGEVQSDSVLHVHLYPEEPIIAYSTFRVNENNFIDIHNGEKIYADVLMQSNTDSCSVSIYANPADSVLQNVEAVIKNLNLGSLMTVLPFLPQMSGMLEVNANYVQKSKGFTVDGLVAIDDYVYEGTAIGDLMAVLNYQPMGEAGHDINAMLFKDEEHVATIKGNYNVEGLNRLNASAMLLRLPLSVAGAFIEDEVFALSGYISGMMSFVGPIDTLLVNGSLSTENVHVYSDIYSFDLAVEDKDLVFDNSRIDFDELKIYGAGDNPLTVNGYVDFSDLNEMHINLSLYGQNFLVFDTNRTRKTALFGKLYGDFFARVNGTTNDLKIRGLVNVLNTTNITYIMTNTPLSIDYRLDDIVTFVDFYAPPTEEVKATHTFLGLDMNIRLEIEDGAKVRCEFSADKQSYVNVQGGGTLTMSYTPEGVFNLLGRYTVNDGEMKYTLPVIPLKTFTIAKGCYIEFTGKPSNPTMNITATEQTKASVSNSDGSSRTVLFDVGLKISNTLENMVLEFTIDAPEDIAVQNELAGLTSEEKNKLAVALLATGMYLSSSNQSGFSTSNALNNFLQTEINNIAGKAVSSATKIDMSVGMEQTKRDDGTTRTDYSFKFTKRFFSDRLNVVIGGRINADGNRTNNEAGAYIDDVSLEWRLDNGGTQYIRLFHDKNYDNLVEGELTENGMGVVLRKKLDSITDLFIWKKKSNDKEGK